MIYALAGVVLGPVVLVCILMLLLFFIFWPLALLLLLALGVCGSKFENNLRSNVIGAFVFGVVSLVMSSFILFDISVFNNLGPWWETTLKIAGAIGLWFVIYSGIPIIAIAIMCARNKRLPEPYTCRTCSYDLEKITSSRCPECGEQNPFSQAVG